MYAKAAAILLLVATSIPSAAIACDRRDACDLTKYVTEEEFPEFKKLLREFKQRRSSRLARQKSSSAALATKGSQLSLAGKADTPVPSFAPPAPTTSVKFLLRKDFADIRLFSDIVSNADAEGADFAVTRDRIVHDTTWSADAIAAIAYTYTVEDIHSTFMGFTLAPYIRVNRELHSNKVDDNIDTKTLGLSGEVGFRNRVFGKSDHFRARVAVIEDDVEDRRISHATGEWIPYYLSDARTVPGTFINYSFIPELKVQYDSTSAIGKTLVFSGRQESFRIGPEATVRFKVLVPDTFLYDYLKRLTGTVTYHWWTETYSGRRDSWLDTSLTYNLDEEGHIALKLSYKHGRSEETGALADLYKIALTAKTCAELLKKEGC